MRKVVFISVIALLALFFGYGLFSSIQYRWKAQSDRKMLTSLETEDVAAVTMRWSMYEYSFSEGEINEFMELFHKIELGEVTREHEIHQGDGCSVDSEIEINTHTGKTIHMETPVPYGMQVAVINEIGYESSHESLQPMAEFLSRIMDREFVSVNNQTPVSAHFPLKSVKDEAVESVTLRKGDQHYQFTQQEILEFTQQFWDLAAYEKIEEYKALKDINDVFEAELIIEKADGESIMVQLNYKVILINNESYLFKLGGHHDFYSYYSYIERQMEKLS